MKVAIYTLTRERIWYTRQCFSWLRERAGYDFQHYVIDNGSQDGTAEWLKDSYKPHWLALLAHNVGIARAANMALNRIREDKPDLIIKFDNDAEIITHDILAYIVKAFETVPRPFVLSPRVEGLRNPVTRHGSFVLDCGLKVGLTQIVGGIFHCVPASVYFQYRYNETLPLAKGNDGHFCRWLRDRGVGIGYLEDLQVNHFETTDGQWQRFPKYFERKMMEEKQIR